MKKVYILLIMFLLLFIPNTYAEDLKYYDLTLYDKEAVDDFSANDLFSLSVIADSEGFHNCEMNFEEKIYTVCNEDGYPIYSVYGGSETDPGTFKANQNAPIDMIEHSFTNEEKEFIESNTEEELEFLKGLDGIRLILKVPCDSVCIRSVVIDDISDEVIINNDPSFSGLEMNLDVAFANVNDYVTYKVDISNPTEKDYEISTGEDFTTSEYIKYKYAFENDDNILESNSRKSMYVTVRYNKEVPVGSFNNGSFKEDNKAVIKLANGVEEPSASPTPTLSPTGNQEVRVPDTYTGISVFVVIFIIAVLGYIAYGKPSKKMMLLFVPLLLIPVLVYAYEKIEIKLETHIEIKQPFSILMSKAATTGGEQPMTLWNYDTVIKTITFERQIREVNNYLAILDVSNKQDRSILAYIIQNQEESDKVDVYIMSDGLIYANPDSSSWFSNMTNLEAINNIDYINTSQVTNMESMFRETGRNVTNFVLDLGSNFDTSKVKNTSYMFAYAGLNSTTFSLRLGDKFDTSNITTMQSMFTSAGLNSTIFNLDLGDMFIDNIRNGTNQIYMFCATGEHANYIRPSVLSLEVDCSPED